VPRSPLHWPPPAVRARSLLARKGATPGSS
jgi:hypothetical protein